MLLNSVYAAQELAEKGNEIEFTVQHITEGDEQVCKAVPIIKHQEQPKTVFGNGVQLFLDMLLEEKGPCKTFETSVPTATIVYINPTTLINGYSATGGRVIILTATPGDRFDRKEFKTLSEMNIVSLPRYNDNNMEVIPSESLNFAEMITKVRSFAKDNPERPILVFLDTRFDAIDFHKKLGIKAMLCVDSEEEQCKDIASSAGKNGAITITTQKYGRGVDFKTNHPKGIMLYNLCTEITKSEEEQIHGRTACNGQHGTVHHICDQANSSCEDYMNTVSEKRQDKRLQDKPLSYVLQYVPKMSHGETERTIHLNKIIAEAWEKINLVHRVTVENVKSLREKLVNAIAKLPEFSAKTIKDLREYLEAKWYHIVSDDLPELDDLGSVELYRPPMVVMPNAEHAARSISVKSIPITSDRSYQNYLPLHYMVMTTHIFSLVKTEFDFKTKKFKAEGSFGNLMLEEFKVAFSNYQQFAKSRKVSALRALVDRFTEIRDLNVIQPDKWQPVAIFTKVTSETGHAETLLFNFNKKILLWVNSEDGGIKIFQIKQSFEQLKDVLNKLKTPHSQTETREKIWALFRDTADSADKTEPKHLTIPTPKQTIGNCGWQQVEYMLKAFAFIESFDFNGNLPDQEFVGTQKWQSALDKANSIYSDFKLFNQAARLEGLVCLADQDECKPEFLNSSEKDAITAQTTAVSGIITLQLLARTAEAAGGMVSKTKGTVYETSVHTSQKSLSVLSAPWF